MAWENPKTDWVTNPKNPKSDDFNRIEGNIDFLKNDIETKKGALVDALNTVGLASELTDTHAELANRITSANQGTKIYTPTTENITIPKGVHSGQGHVKGDVDLTAGNIIKGKSIFGVNGSFDKELSKLDVLTLRALCLPSYPVGINNIPSRLRSITATGDPMYAPTNKTWYVLNYIAPTYVGDNTVALNKPIQPLSGYILEVLELDYKCVTANNASSADLPADAQMIIPQARSTATSAQQYSISTSVGGGTGTASVLYKSGFGGTLHDLSLPMITTQQYLDLVRAEAICILANLGISVTHYTMGANQTVTVGTVPSGEQWLLGITAMQLLINGDIIPSRSNGVFLMQPGTNIKLRNNQTYERNGGAFLLKLQL